MLLLQLICLVCCHSGTSTSVLEYAAETNGSQPNNPQNNFFPEASHPAPLRIVSLGGSVLASPGLQLVTFNGDAAASSLADLSGKLGTSTYWRDTTAEYGVGPIAAATARSETFAWPANTTDGDLNAGENSDVEAYLVSQLDGTAPRWGSPDSNTIYALLMPAGVIVSPDGGQTPNACNANIIGWHTAMLLPESQVVVAYAVIPDCGQLGSLSELDARTVALSHEVVETATDPHLDGFGAVDSNHQAWQLAASNPEIASACVAALGSASFLTDKPADLPYAVQRSWSNAAAQGGHQPCVPSTAGEVFFSATPVLSQPTGAATGGVSTAAAPPGIDIPVGQTATVMLALYSDGPTGEPWTVSVYEIGSNVLHFSQDKTTGSNGDNITLSVTAGSANPTGAQELVAVVSTQGTRVGNDYFIVRN